MNVRTGFGIEGAVINQENFAYFFKHGCCNQNSKSG
jgi:hypothetical protein